MQLFFFFNFILTLLMRQGQGQWFDMTYYIFVKYQTPHNFFVKPVISLAKLLFLNSFVKSQTFFEYFRLN